MPVEIGSPLKKLLPYLLKAAEDNLNEADTVQRLVKAFEDVFGYDVLTEITREMQVKDKYVDIALKIDGATRLLIEAKAAGVELRDRHIEQAERYAAEGNIRWVLLTNGVVWNLYHLTFDEGIEYERAFSVNLLSDPFEQAAETLGLLHRHSIRKGELESYWAQKMALSPESVAQSLFVVDILGAIRRNLRRRAGVLIDEEDLANALHRMLSVEARERIGPMKIYRPRKPAKKAASSPSSAGPVPNSPSATASQSSGPIIAPAQPTEQ